MASVTIYIEEEVLQRARIEAARHKQSLSRFLGELLKEKCTQEDEYGRAMNEYLSRPPWPLSNETPRADGRHRPRREELYDRKCLK